MYPVGTAASSAKKAYRKPTSSLPVFSAQSAPNGSVGAAYSYTFIASGSPTFSLGSGTLPAGLSLSSAGVLNGTPTTAAGYTFVVRATNGGGSTDSTSQGVTVSESGALKVIPGLYGYGSDTVAGRGGTVYRVTNLNDSGAGSLRAAIQASGPRVVIFEVSGTINLLSRLVVRNPYLTIAGQTAPSPGIILKGAPLLIYSYGGVDAHDILVQHIQVRPGDGPNLSGENNLDYRSAIMAVAEEGRRTYNVVFDHCSMGWGTDQSASIWGTPDGLSWCEDITWHKCIFSEPLLATATGVREDGQAHPMGPLFGMVKRVSVLHSLFAQQKYRNPLFGSTGIGTDNCVMVNNLIYHPGTTGSGQIDLEFGPNYDLNFSIVGNVKISRSGDGTGGKIAWVPVSQPDSINIYASDNRIDGTQKGTDGVGTYGTINTNIFAGTAPCWNTGLTALPSSSVQANVLANAGTRPAGRCPIDTRVIAYVNSGGGADINYPSDVGGYPTYAANTRALTLPANPSADSGNGYTNLEVWLHSYSSAVGA